MKTIKQGTIRRHQGDWWIGKSISCGNCHSEHVLEKGDNVDVYVNGNGHDEVTFLDIACPDCGMTMRIKHKPEKENNGKK